MRKGLTLAQIDELEAQEKARKQAEKEAKRVAAQQKRKEEARLRAAAKKVAQEVAKAPDPKPRATETEPASTPRAANPANQAAVEEAYALPYEPPSYHFGPNDDPYAELAQRELCRRKLLPFIQRFRPKYEAGWVHEDICRRLERFVEQVEQGLSPRLLLMMPVRHGKSEVCSRHFPPWVFGKHPEWEIIAASGAQSLALSFSRYGRDLLQDPAYATVFPDTRLDPSSKSVENWNITKGGGYLSAGIGTMITGRGANILIIDDPVKDGEAADSPTIRESVWEWYMSTAYTRLAPGGGVLGVLTWWNEDDWAGRIQQVMKTGDGDVFEIVKYPALNDQGDEYLLPDDSIEQIPPGAPVPEGARMTRPMGSALHEARYNVHELLKKKSNYMALGQKRWWDALFQQNPIPDDGNYFTKDMFRYYGTAPARNELYIYQAWDFAISTGKESDYTVGTCIGVDHRENVYVLDVMRFRSGDGGHIIDSILDFAEAHNADCLGFEDGQIWKAIEFQFQKRCEERRQYPSHEVLKPLTDKMVRASPLRGRMQLGKVYFDKHAPWFDPVYKELVTFPAGKHDDCCFVAGTQIVMADGTSRAIELVRIGDMVETPLGPRPVTAAAMTSPRATVYEVAGLVGTAGHPIYTQNRGWVPLVTLTESDILQVRESVSNEESSCQGFTKKQQRTSTVWSSMGSCIVATRTLIEHIFAATTRALVGEVSCTETCGSSTTGLSQKAGSSTTSTRTTSTTTFPTLSACPGKSTQSTGTQSRMLTALLKNSLRTSLAFVRKLLSGTVPQKASLGTARTEKMLGKIVSASHWPVPIAETSSGRSFPMLSSVQSPAGTSIGTKLIQNTTLPKMLAEERPVFNITVADAHCYYANDVLVHNCDSLAWAIRLTLTRAAPRAIETRPKMKSWKDKLIGSSRGGSHMAA